MHTQSRPVAARRDLHMCYQTTELIDLGGTSLLAFLLESPCSLFSPPTTFTLSSFVLALPGHPFGPGSSRFQLWNSPPTFAGLPQSHKGHRDSPSPPAPRVGEKPEPEV